MDLLAIAIAPGIAIILFILHRDAYNREPKLNLLVSFVLGGLSILPAIFIEQLFYNQADNSIAGIAVKAFLVVALTEEVVKYVALRYYSFRQPSFDEPLDGIVYGVVVSMGFATVENILYVQKFGMTVGIQRMFLAVPAHATFGVLMGYFAGKARFSKDRQRLLLTGVFWATVFHGAYDFFLFLQQSPEVNANVSAGLLTLGAIASLLVSLRLSLRHLKQHRRLSQKTNRPTDFMLVRRAGPNEIPVIQSLAYEVWPATYQSVLSKEQIDYMMDMMYSTASLEKQLQAGHEFVIIYDDNVPVGFASFSRLQPDTFKLHKLYVLPSQQGRGTGRFAIDRLAGAMHRDGASKMRLNVNRNNQARIFYEKLGFVVIGEEDIDIGKGYLMNDFIMEKNIG